MGARCCCCWRPGPAEPLALSPIGAGALIGVGAGVRPRFFGRQACGVDVTVGEKIGCRGVTLSVASVVGADGAFVAGVVVNRSVGEAVARSCSRCFCRRRSALRRCDADCVGAGVGVGVGAGVALGGGGTGAPCVLLFLLSWEGAGAAGAFGGVAAAAAAASCSRCCRRRYSSTGVKELFVHFLAVLPLMKRWNRLFWLRDISANFTGAFSVSRLCAPVHAASPVPRSGWVPHRRPAERASASLRISFPFSFWVTALRTLPSQFAPGVWTKGKGSNSPSVSPAHRRFFGCAPPTSRPESVLRPCGAAGAEAPPGHDPGRPPVAPPASPRELAGAAVKPPPDRPCSSSSMASSSPSSSPALASFLSVSVPSLAASS